MAYDAKLILYDAATSGSIYVGANTALDRSLVLATDGILLPGTPLRGLNLNVVLPVAQSTPSLAIWLQEAVSVGVSAAGWWTFAQYPRLITAAGEYNTRFHLNKGYPAVRVAWSLSSGLSGGGFGASAVVRIGMDRGAFGNG